MIDYVVKLGILEGRNPRDTIFLAPFGTMANPCYARMWRPHLAMAEAEEELPLPLQSLTTLSFDYKGPRLDDGSTVFYRQRAASTHRRWHADQRGPLLTVPPELEQRGWDTLAKASIPRSAWFVALHVREAGFRSYHALLQDARNARIVYYIPAIQEITRRGGWVVRMGDPSSTIATANCAVTGWTCSCGRPADSSSARRPVRPTCPRPLGYLAC